MRDKVKDPLIGCTLPGGHVVMELIDFGGMGRVYRAEQQMLGRTVAVKIIHPHLLGDATVEARFITEARAASQLNHPNSVAVIDFGKFEGRLYMVMEYIRGRDLATVAHEEGPLAIARVIDVLTQALAALEEAHHIGIIHRDLKPENIVLSPLRSGGDFVKVLDFGLAKVREAAQQQRITDPGMVCGTPEYMAPEQARGDELDQRVDLYACGVLLYELLAGQLPFDADTPREVVLMHLSKAPPDIRVIAPHRDLPQLLVDIVVKALQKDPADRFQSAAEFAEALKGSVSPDSVAAASGPPTLQKCQRCSNMMPLRQKFCGECGARLFKPISTLPNVTKPTTPRADVPRFPPPFVGRHHELRWLGERREEASGALVGALIAGAPGVGRTRLLARFAKQQESAGDLVVHVRPDPWWAQPGYYVLRELIRELGQVSEGGNTSWPGITPEARAGMMTIFGHGKTSDKNSNGRPWLSALTSTDAAEQRELVADALRWALSRANDRTKGVVILLVDDLHAIDGASRNALCDILADPPLVPGLVVVAHDAVFEANWDGCEAMELHGMPVDVARSLMGEEADLLDEIAAGRATLVPLYIEQLLRFAVEGGRNPPMGLADLVAMRIERLPADARRVLQAIAVLGDITTSTHLVGLVPDVNELSRCLSELNNAGIVVINHGEAAISHPFIRDVIIASTPHGVRAELHANARRDFGVDGPAMPIEAQALHAYHADESFEALMLLEQCAQSAHRRDDHQSAVMLWHLALDLARREMARGELDDPVGAVLMFSAKLGDALALAGNPTDAQGVLSEALNVAPPTAAERPRLLASLANAERLAGRADAAYNHLEEALHIAETHRRKDLVESLEDIRSRWVAGL